MLRRSRKNERGVIFVTVIMIIMVMMVLTISLMSLNVSEVKNTESEVRRLQAEALTTGTLARQYAMQNILVSSPPRSSVLVKLGNITYNVTTVRVGDSFNVTTTFVNP